MSTPSRDPPVNSPPSGAISSRSSMDSPSTSSRTPSLRIPSMPSAAAQHRQSFHELRGLPPSPRASRQSSLSHIAVQDLIDNPPMRTPDPKFVGRNWQEVKVKELVNPDDLRFSDIDTGVEAATNLLIESGAPVVLIRERAGSPVIGTFDHRDLNAYLLLVVGLSRPNDEDHEHDFLELARRAREGKPINLRQIQDLSKKEPLTFLDEDSDLIKAIETFGKGVHRVVVRNEATKEATGVLSQSRLVRFLWENGRSFPVLDQLYLQALRELRIGSNDVIAINGDRPLFEALTLLLNEGVSSLPVIDHNYNVIGNISSVDVKLLTKSSSLPLLRNTCIHFITVILSTRGMYEGMTTEDSVPVFHVTPLSTLAHTVAKLVATKSHRMWITEPVSPSSSGPPTPSLHTATLVPTSSHSSSLSHTSSAGYMGTPPLASTTPSSDPFSNSPGTVVDSSPKLPFIAAMGPSISAAALPGARISGRLVGVVSLTDILILFARVGGLMDVADPTEIRMRRRRSSSSSVRRSMDLGQHPSVSSISSSGLRPSGELSRKGSATKGST